MLRHCVRGNRRDSWQRSHCCDPKYLLQLRWRVQSTWHGRGCGARVHDHDGDRDHGHGHGHGHGGDDGHDRVCGRLHRESGRAW